MAVQGFLRLSARTLAALALLCAAAHAQRAEEGLASWYGAPFDGQKAASGETYRQGELTAAHRTLPFGTTVRIRRVDNGATVVVRINDRGPFVESRIVDLSNAAARKLGMLEHGVVHVALEILQAAPAGIRTLFAVQAGTFRLLENAERTRASLERLYGAARIVPSGPDSTLWCVLVGSPDSQATAEALAAAVRKSVKGLESAFVVKVAPPGLSVTE